MADEDLDALDLLLLENPTLALGERPGDFPMSVEPPFAYDGKSIFFRTTGILDGFSDGVLNRRLFFVVRRQTDAFFDEDEDGVPELLHGMGLLSLIQEPTARKAVMEQIKLRTLGTAVILKHLSSPEVHAWSLAVKTLSRLPLA